MVVGKSGLIPMIVEITPNSNHPVLIEIDKKEVVVGMKLSEGLYLNG
jgi:hypothetical protein